jgi:hypothetical protein
MDCRHQTRKDASGDIQSEPGFQHSMLERRNLKGSA